MATAPLLNEQTPSGPARIRNYQVTVDRNLCIGATTCVAIAPQTFLLDSEAKAIILSSAPADSDATILDAARGCPVAAIIIQDESGKRIFPE